MAENKLKAKQKKYLSGRETANCSEGGSKLTSKVGKLKQSLYSSRTTACYAQDAEGSSTKQQPRSTFQAV